jgi:hypothetical protein
MKKLTLLLLFTALCSLDSFAQKKLGSSSQKNMAIGVRVGDPTGLTLKKYFGNSALEFNAGVPTYIFGRYDYGYYYTHSNKYNKNGYYGYAYNPVFSYAMQLHFTQLFDISAVEGLQWYAGGGLQLRQNIFETTYYDNYYGRAYTEKVAATDFGLDAVGGAEYTFAKVPFSVFADVTVFVNVINGARVYLQPGVGGRYNF